ncbi:MAG: hypothetical protein ABIJ16_07635 [Bacteroidota bacterium]
MRKKLLVMSMFVLMAFGAGAQVTLTTAVDFTANDVYGTQVHLFDLLAQGKYVALEFWTSW